MGYRYRNADELYADIAEYHGRLKYRLAADYAAYYDDGMCGHLDCDRPLNHPGDHQI